MTRLATTLLVAAVAAAGAFPARSGAGDEPLDTRDAERVTGGGRLAWVLDGDLDAVGDLWTDIPFRVGPRDSLYVAIDTRTDMDRSSDDFTFAVQDLQYELDLGWRSRRAGAGKVAFSLFAGQRGKEQVDTDGSAFVRYLGLGIESAGYRRRVATPACAGTGCGWRDRLDWRLAGGPVVDESEIEASFVLRGTTRFWLGRAGRSSLGVGLTFDGVVQDGGYHADVAVGPRLLLPAGDALASFFLSYQHSDNPLGRSEPLWLLGFGFEQGQGRTGASPARVEGLLAGGGGSGRAAGELKLQFRLLHLPRDYWGVIAVDANVLTADDVSDLFYLYQVGVERPWRQHLLGLFFYHRSNHQLSRPNATITSINVLECGLESPAWDRPGTRAGGARDRLDFRARAGYLVDSTFGERRRWHARAGARWSAPTGRGKPQAYLLADAETGDVEQRRYAVGAALSPSLELQLEYRSDEQNFSRNDRIWLLTARYGLGSPSLDASVARAR